MIPTIVVNMLFSVLAIWCYRVC